MTISRDLPETERRNGRYDADARPFQGVMDEAHQVIDCRVWLRHFSQLLQTRLSSLIQWS
jgi:hypothetical protein